MTKISKNLLYILAVLIVSSCSAITNVDKEGEYPLDLEERRRAKHGKLTGDGIVLFGKKSDSDESGGGPAVGIGINSYLWRAALDTLSFMPLASADPFGGVIITDWHEPKENEGQRFKLNILILDKKLRSNAVKVSAFKQKYDAKTKSWRDTTVKPNVSRDIENKILTRARELRVKKEQN